MVETKFGHKIAGIGPINDKKIVVFKFKPKKKYRRKQGHRQPYTKLVVKKIEVK